MLILNKKLPISAKNVISLAK